MPMVQADRLTRIGAALLKAAGASEEEAHAVADGCVNANLAGHDSHGVIAIPTYIDRIKAGDAEAWAPRVAKGMDALLASVNAGLNAMPPKGMCFDCTDADYTALIQYMSAPAK